MKRLIYPTLTALILLHTCCSKDDTTKTASETPIVNPQVDPETAKTMGFFLDDWTPKNYTSPASFIESAVPETTTSTVTVDYSKVITKIPNAIYGNNANLWSGKMVTNNALVTDISNLKTHIIRFPGGSISDVYFWNAAGNPTTVPATLRKADGTEEAANFWFGQNDADWTISLENYYQLLQATNSKGIITVNYGYARYGTGTNPVQDAAQLAADWVTYDNGRTKYWEIGNENFGSWEAGCRINPANNQDGQPEFLNGQLYAQHFAVIAQAMRNAAAAVGNTGIKIGAVMFEGPPETWMDDNNRTWNEKMLPAIQENADYYVLHNYFTASDNVNATQILESPKTKMGAIMNYVKNDLSTRQKQEKPFALDEWNIFASGSKQQVSHVNGMHGVMVLGEALKNKMGLAARWDFFNGWSNGDDHGLFSNGDEPNIPKGNPRPAFYHMYYFQKNMGDRLIEANKDAVGNYEVYASSFTNGEVGLTFVNKATTAINVKIKLNNFLTGKRMYWYQLVGGIDNGEFSGKVIVNGFTTTLEAGGPSDYAAIKPYSAVTKNGTNVTLPARSSVFVVIENR